VNDEHLAAFRSGCSEFVEQDLVIHVRSCDACTTTMLESQLFTTWMLARIADRERLFALAEPGTAALRFTEFRLCEDCGAEIFGTRQLDERGAFWANRLDNRLHSCKDFLGVPEVVGAWSRSKRRPGSTGQSKGWGKRS
jgi:hypothetical protein